MAEHPLLIGGGFSFPGILIMSGFTCDNVTDSYATGGGLANGADSTAVLDSSTAFAHYMSTSGFKYVPKGNYRLKPGVAQFTANDCVLWMEPGAKILIDDSLGNSGQDGFLAKNVRRCGITGYGEISAPSTRAAGYAVHIQGGDSSLVIPTTQMAANQFMLDVDMSKQFSGVLVNDDTGKGCWQSTIGSGLRPLIWNDFAAGAPVIVYDTPGGAGHNVNWLFARNGLGASIGGPTIQVLGTGDLSLVKVDALGFKNGFLLNNTNPIATPGTGGGVCHIMMVSCQFDNTGQGTDADNIRIVPGNITQPINISITNTWCATGTNGIFMQGFTGANCKLSFDGGALQGAGPNNPTTSGYGVRGIGAVLNTNVFLGPTIKYSLNAVANTLFT